MHAQSQSPSGTKSKSRHGFHQESELELRRSGARPLPTTAPHYGPHVQFTGAVMAGAAVALVLAWGSPAHAQPPATGLDAFIANGCHQCHGYEGQGGVAGPRIGPSLYPYDLFAQLVRRPANTMPAYAPSVLADADLRAIYDYVRSVPEPPAIDEIDILAAR